MRRFASLVAWWALLVAVWSALVGTTTRLEILFGTAAAAVGAISAEVIRSTGLLAYRVDHRALLQAWRVPREIVSDFAVITWELARAIVERRRVKGSYVGVPWVAGGTTSTGRWRRAWTTVAGSMSPNAIVVDVDADRDLALMHSLRPDIRSGRRPL